MKKLLFAVFVLIAISGYAQTDPTQRDSLANDPAWKTRVRISGINAANLILADTTRKEDWLYSFFIILNPRNDYWITQLSYGILTNPVVTSTSSQSDIDFTMATIFSKYSKAYTGTVYTNQSSQ